MTSGVQVKPSVMSGILGGKYVVLVLGGWPWPLVGGGASCSVVVDGIVPFLGSHVSVFVGDELERKRDDGTNSLCLYHSGRGGFCAGHGARGREERGRTGKTRDGEETDEVYGRGVYS